MYGAWIGKNKVHPVAHSMEHESVAAEILGLTVGGIPVKDPKRYSVYKIMYSLGYVRVVYGSLGYAADYWKLAKFSPLQKDWIACRDNTLDKGISIYEWEVQKSQHM